MSVAVVDFAVVAFAEVSGKQALGGGYEAWVWKLWQTFCEASFETDN
jgi:hypothetical protein